MMATILIDFDQTIFRGHLHNLIIDLYNNYFLAWVNKCAELGQARVLGDAASIERLKGEASRLAQQPNTRWATYIFKNGYPKVEEEDPSFNRRCFEFLCSHSEYFRSDQQESNFAMQISSASHTWKEVIEGLIDRGHKVVIASFSSFPGVLKIFLQEVLQLDPIKLESIPIVSWLPEYPDSANKNHHLLQGILLAQHSASDGEVVLVDDSQRNLDGARMLGYKIILAMPDGRHLTDVFERYIQQAQATVAYDDVRQFEQDARAECALRPQELQADISLYRREAALLFSALEQSLKALLKEDEQLNFVSAYQQAKMLFEDYKKAVLGLELAAVNLMWLDKTFMEGPTIAQELIRYFEHLPRITHDLESLPKSFFAKFHKMYKKFIELFQEKITLERFNSRHSGFSDMMQIEYPRADAAVKNFKRFLQDAREYGVVFEHGDEWHAHAEHVLNQAQLAHQAYVSQQSRPSLSQPLIACSEIFLTSPTSVTDGRDVKTPPPPYAPSGL
jgi:hypothetical protein